MPLEDGKKQTDEGGKDNNPLYYLSPEEQQLIKDWAKDLFPLLEKYSQLKKTDLVIEGGFGNGITLPHIMRLLFPTAKYVGIDLARGFGSYFSGEESYGKIASANEHPTLAMDKAKINGNCFDLELIQQLVRLSSSQYPVLCSWNALNALFDRKMNPWDSKRSEDRRSPQDVVAENSPYRAQFHMGVDWEDNSGFSSYYFSLEDKGKEAGWVTERFDNGLLLVRPEK